MTSMLRIVPDKCTGCMQCELACGWVQTGLFQPSRSVMQVNVFDEEASYAPFTCVQCDEAWCLTACPVNAIGIDDDDFSRCDVAFEARADDVECAALRRDQPSVFQPAQAQGANAQRIACADQLAPRQGNQRIRPFDLAQSVRDSVQ